MSYCERKQYLPYFSAGIGGWLDEQICTSFKDILRQLLRLHGVGRVSLTMLSQCRRE